MNLQELYSILENQYWLEPTDKENIPQNMRWRFYQPVKHIEGLFMLEYSYQGRSQTESGKCDIDISDGKAVIKINEAEFYLSFKDHENTMLWYSTKSGKTRTFERIIADN